MLFPRWSVAFIDDGYSMISDAMERHRKRQRQWVSSVHHLREGTRDDGFVVAINYHDFYPTNTRPGSKERQQVYVDRARRGNPIHHRNDDNSNPLPACKLWAYDDRRDWMYSEDVENEFEEVLKCLNDPIG